MRLHNKIDYINIEIKLQNNATDNDKKKIKEQYCKMFGHDNIAEFYDIDTKTTTIRITTFNHNV